MEIQIELIMILLIIVLLLLWAIWFRLSRWYYRRKYKPENDKSRQGEEIRRRDIEIAGTTFSTRGSPPVEPKELLPAAEVGSDGEGSTTIKQDSPSPRGFFARRRKKVSK